MISPPLAAGMRRFAAFALIFFLILSLIIPRALKAQEAINKTVKRVYDPVEILGEKLPSLVGKPLDHFALYAYENGKLQAIAFQFDERTPARKFVFPHGPEGKPNEGNNLLDVQDFLVFMVSDCGDRAAKKDFPAGAKEIAEIELRDPVNNSRGWVYLAYYSERLPAPAFKPKVYLEPNKEALTAHGQTWMFEGLVNNLGGKIYRTIFNKKYYTSREGGGNGQNILDRMKARTSGSFLFGAIKFAFNEGSASGGMFAYKLGPVRCFGSNWLQMSSASGIKTPKFWLDAYIYDYLLWVPLYLKVYFNPGYVLTYFQFRFGYDFNESARGMKFYNSNNQRGYLIDGKMSEAERGFNTDMDTWRLVTGPQGTMIFATLWDPKFSEQADIQAYYSDDTNVKDPPEDIPGNLGAFGCQAMVESLEAGEYQNLVGWFLPPNFYDPNRLRVDIINDYFRIRGNPLEISVNRGAFFESTGGRPSTLH